MIIFATSIFKILEEQNILKTTKTKPIVDAIKNRKKIDFYYSGPRKGRDSVKSGKRESAELVAIVLSKRGNLIVRAYVDTPSVSKKLVSFIDKQTELHKVRDFKVWSDLAHVLINSKNFIFLN
mgnify:CR=1 FL=1